MADKAQVSKLQPVSIGLAVSNKELNSAFVEVNPIETMPIQSGEIADNPTTYSASAVDSEGRSYQSNTTTKASVTAEWLPLGNANRMTPPDVRRGEMLMLYQFGDVGNKYYWNTMKNDLAFRKLETVVYAFSATQDESAKPNHDNCYFIEVSSHKGSISVHTTQANNEPFAYDIVLNTKEGNFSIVDDIGNKIILDSAEHKFRVENPDGSFMDLTRKVFQLTAEDSVAIKTKDYSLNADSTISMKTSTSTLDASTNTVTAQTTNNGQVNVNGPLSQGGGSNGGNASFNGTMDVVGKITGEAEIHAATVTAQEIHGVHVTSDTAISAPNV